MKRAIGLATLFAAGIIGMGCTTTDPAYHETKAKPQVETRGLKVDPAGDDNVEAPSAGTGMHNAEQPPEVTPPPVPPR